MQDSLDWALRQNSTWSSCIVPLSSVAWHLFSCSSYMRQCFGWYWSNVMLLCILLVLIRFLLLWWKYYLREVSDSWWELQRRLTLIRETSHAVLPMILIKGHLNVGFLFVFLFVFVFVFVFAFDKGWPWSEREVSHRQCSGWSWSEVIPVSIVWDLFVSTTINQRALCSHRTVHIHTLNT